jgi:isopentenyldiphosphate isomerase
MDKMHNKLEVADEEASNINSQAIYHNQVQSAYQDHGLEQDQDKIYLATSYSYNIRSNASDYDDEVQDINYCSNQGMIGMIRMC